MTNWQIEYPKDTPRDYPRTPTFWQIQDELNFLAIILTRSYIACKKGELCESEYQLISKGVLKQKQFCLDILES